MTQGYDYFADLVEKDPEVNLDRAFYRNQLPGTSPASPIDSPEYLHGEDPGPAGAAFLSGFVENPQKKMELFARSRFPNQPLEQSIKRYGYIDGKVVYIDDEGKLQKEIDGFGGGASELAGRYGLPMIGTALGTPGGPAGMALGAMGGLAGRKLVGMALGDDQSAGGNALDIALEGATTYGFSKAGELVGNFAMNRQVVRDIKNFDPTKTEHVIALGRKFNIDITPAEASQLGSLLRQQMRLGMGMDEAGDLMTAYYKKRAAQQGAAIENFIGKPPTAVEGGSAARESAIKLINRVKEIRKLKSKPFYDQYVRPDVLVDEDEFGKLLAHEDYGAVLRHFIKKVKSDPLISDKLRAAPDNSLAIIDEAQKAMWEASQKSGMKRSLFKAGRIKAARRALTSFADDQFDGYAAAREAYKGASPLVDKLEQGIEGQLSRLENDSLAKAGRSVFASDEVSPETIRRARLMFWVNGKRDEWDGLVNRWLFQQWETIDDSTPIREFSKPMWWQKRVFGTAQKREMMKEAMGPDRFASLNDLMEVLDASLSVAKGQSMTEPAMQAAKAEARAAAPIASMGEGFGIRGLRNWWIDKRVGNFRTEIAKVITNQRSMTTLEQLHALKSVNPQDPILFELAFLALGQAGVNGLKSMDTPENIRPPMLGAQQ